MEGSMDDVRVVELELFAAVARGWTRRRIVDKRENCMA
jgi:hypothetical protein